MKLNSFFFDRRGTVSNRWITIACVLLCIASPAFGSDKCGSLDRAANPIRLAEILYPELRGKEFSLQFSDGSGPLSGPAEGARPVRELEAKFFPPELWIKYFCQPYWICSPIQ